MAMEIAGAGTAQTRRLRTCRCTYTAYLACCVGHTLQAVTMPMAGPDTRRWARATNRCGFVVFFEISFIRLFLRVDRRVT